MRRMKQSKVSVILVSLFILILFYDKSADATEDMRYYESISDHRLLSHAMKEVKTADLNTCTNECSQTPGCKSSNYKITDRVCEMNTAEHVTKPLYLMKEEGYIYFRNPNPKAKARNIEEIENSKPYYKNCAKVKEDQPTAASGLYEILVNGSIKQIYCDMENFEGGWSLAVSISGSDTNHLIRNENNCFNSSYCVPLATGTLVARKMKDTDIHALASHEGTFRFDVTSTTATIYTLFYRLSQGPQMFDAGCDGISCARQIISHVYPYVWEFNCRGIDFGYHVAGSCYKVLCFIFSV
ncbi:uncharacterized protein LOC116302523 isoform X2 [Actinia tenebrosa]|uniref:Uncharacterized protein LOC116302523 isoform X2 n=1 Tax=Actinia tenebrosa TaxID=6105 RepID=A0A6P8ILL6_ACTTE|nr:uncharacterized protein LOC116302523 isoform X2 [Actinia tenebrosa]